MTQALDFAVDEGRSGRMNPGELLELAKEEAHANPGLSQVMLEGAPPVPDRIIEGPLEVA